MLPTNDSGKPITNDYGAGKPVNPFMYYSAFKLAIYFENNKQQCKPFHSVETRNTVPQIVFKKINEIVLDRRTGFQWCIETVERMKNKIHFARLYSAYDDTYFADFHNGKWFMINEPQFNEENRIVISRQFTVKNGFAILHDIEANSLAVKN